MVMDNGTDWERWYARWPVFGTRTVGAPVPVLLFWRREVWRRQKAGGGWEYSLLLDAGDAEWSTEMFS